MRRHIRSTFRSNGSQSLPQFAQNGTAVVVVVCSCCFTHTTMLRRILLPIGARGGGCGSRRRFHLSQCIGEFASNPCRFGQRLLVAVIVIVVGIITTPHPQNGGRRRNGGDRPGRSGAGPRLYLSGGRLPPRHEGHQEEHAPPPDPHGSTLLLLLREDHHAHSLTGHSCDGAKLPSSIRLFDRWLSTPCLFVRRIGEYRERLKVSETLMRIDGFPSWW